MGSVRARFWSGRTSVGALASALLLSSACGRTGLLPGYDGGRDGPGGAGGGSGGRGFGGAAGNGQVEPRGGAGAGGVAGNAGAQTGGVAGSGGQPQPSLYCGAGKRAVLYLLTSDGVILRVDADTLETLTRARIDAPPLYSLTATDTGVVYATSVLDLHLYLIDPLSGQAVNARLSESVFASNNSALSVGFSPADPVLFGDTLLLAQLVLGEGVDLYAAPVGSGRVPLWRHRFEGMTENPRLAVAPDGRTFALLSDGFVEYDPGILSQLAKLTVPGLAGRSGAAAYLSGYLLAVYAVSQTQSRLYRAQVMPDLEDSPIEAVGSIADFITGIGAACEVLP
jgi:hypothetical protein